MTTGSTPPNGTAPPARNGQQYGIYRNVIQRVLNDDEHLPSLPAISLKIRQALADSNTCNDKLADIISKDPALCALLMKTASSPLYITREQPQNIRDVIALLGMQAVGNLAMVHGVRSAFLLRSPVLKQLFNHTWRRLAVKASFANLLAQKIGYRPSDKAMIAALLTEVGSLAVLSAVQDLEQVPDADTYFALCRSYSKSLSSILLNKWNLNAEFITVVKQAGDWEATHGGDIALIDIVNLALYNTILHTPKAKPPPPINTLSAFHKLKPPYNLLKKPGLLSLVVDNRQELQAMVKSFV